MWNKLCYSENTSAGHILPAKHSGASAKIHLKKKEARKALTGEGIYLKKLMIALLAASLLLGVGTGISYAYLTAWDSADNRFETSDVEIAVDETFVPPQEFTPGKVITKEPRLKNTAKALCYVRAQVRFSDSDMQNLCEPLQIGSGWEDGNDGYYYWTKKLGAGESTAPLFSNVTLKNTSADQAEPFEIYVYGEAVACENKSMQEAWQKMEGTV